MTVIMPERYFLSYSGIRLPLKLTSPIGADELKNRNTYLVARYDEQDRLIQVTRMVYGDAELEHSYEYQSNGNLKQAEITIGGETQVIEFDEQGRRRG